MNNKVHRYNLKQLKLDILFGLCAIFAIAIDQVSKYWVVNFVPLNEQITLIPGFLYITHIKNSGGAFGIFQNVYNCFYYFHSVNNNFKDSHEFKIIYL